VTHRTGHSAQIVRISRIFPGLWEATAITSGKATGSAPSWSEGLTLDRRELPDPHLGQVHHLPELVPAERASLRGALELDQLPGTGHHHVEVHLRLRVLFVAQVEQGVVAYQAGAHRGDLIDD